jgi:hypothetical protein
METERGCLRDLQREMERGRGERKKDRQAREKGTNKKHRSVKFSSQTDTRDGQTARYLRDGVLNDRPKSFVIQSEQSLHSKCSIWTVS